MQAATRLYSLLFMLLLFVAGPMTARADAPLRPEPLEKGNASTIINVGITEYQPLSSTYAKYYCLFDELLRANPNERVTFRFAIGTYGEVKDWYDKKAIDVAILSAMPVAELLNSASDTELQAIKQSYIGTLAEIPNRKQFSILDLFKDSPFEAERESEDNMRYMYRTACIVRKDSKLQSLSQLKAMIDDKDERKKVKFIFVRPVSVSGYIFPLSFLRDKHIDPLQPDIALDFTYQHSASLKRLLKPAPEDEKYRDYMVGFVNDTSSYNPKEIDKNLPDEQQFRLLKDDLLETSYIPHEAILINHHLGELRETKKFDELYAQLKRMFDERNKKYEKLRETASGTYKQPEIAKFWPLKMEQPEQWVKQYDHVMTWLQKARLPRDVLYRSNFDDLLKDLSAYKNSPKNKEKPLRLALVLSGGGAKCAYQAGAIAAIESKLRALHDGTEPDKYKDIDKDIDIDLVVGTSGGAINALVTALGVTQKEDGPRTILNTWRSFQQSDFFQPSTSFNIIFGLFFFGLLQMLLVVAGVLLFGREEAHWKALCLALAGLALVELVVAFYFGSPGPTQLIFWVGVQTALALAGVGLIRLLRRATKHWWRLAGCMMLFLSCIEVLLYFWPGPQDWPFGLDESHLFLHFWMLVTLYSIWSFPWPFLIGAIMVSTSFMKFSEKDLMRGGIRLVTVTSIVLVAVAFILVVHVLSGSAPSTEKGIDRAFARGIPALLGMSRPAGDDAKKQLQEVSRQIVTNPDSFKRDLVITNSRLPIEEQAEGEQADGETKYIEANQLPEDLYFYFRKEKTTTPRPSDARFISFGANPEKLLDVVIGSSTIYPIFPSRELFDLKVGNEDKLIEQLKIARKVRIIDGGFIHNSPIEAAQSWGATHIIQIDASPEWEPSVPSNFVQSSMLAFNYLFAQAQRTDQLVKGGVEIFQLRPTSECEKLNLRPTCTDTEQPGMNLFNFTGHVIGQDYYTPQPDMDTFDFAKVLICKAYDRGLKDVQGARPLFQRVPGEPVFRDVPQAP